MNRTRAGIMLIAGLCVVAIAFALGGCGSSSSTIPPAAHSEAAKAKASAKALASSPAVQADIAKAKSILNGCIKTTGVSYIVIHPIAGPRKVIFCTTADLDAMKAGAGACAKKALNTNGIGHGKLTLDETDIAKCLATS